MKLKQRIKAIWAIIHAESFNVNAVYHADGGFMKCTVDLPSDNDRVNETFVFVHRALKNAWNVFIDRKTEPEP